MVEYWHEFAKQSIFMKDEFLNLLSDLPFERHVYSSACWEMFSQKQYVWLKWICHLSGDAADDAQEGIWEIALG